MDNLTVSLEEMIERGIQERFYKTFNGCLLAFTNASDKKQTIAKIIQELGGPTYPFAIATLTNFGIPTTPTLKAHTLMRRGLVSQASTDMTTSYKLGLIPVDSQYQIEYYHKDFAGVKKFAKDWLFASLSASLNVSVTYGTADLDVRVELERSVPIPTREASPTDIPEYVATTNLTVMGFASRDQMEEIQAVTSVVVDGETVTVDQLMEELMAPGVGKQVFLFQSNWPATPGPASTLGDTKDAFPTK